MLFKGNHEARAQHNAVRTTCGWYTWTHDLVEVTGADAAAFLDYLYVNALAGTEVNGSKYTTMLNEEGQILDDVIVMRLGPDRFWVSTLYAPQLIAWMEEHVGTYEIAYRDITEEVAMFSVQGPSSPALMNNISAEPVDSMKRFSLIDSVVDGKEVRIHRGGFTGELGFEIFCNSSDAPCIQDALAKAGEALGATELTILEVYVRSLPVEKGLALRQDLYGLNPYEAGLDWSVDLSKDFIGKEALLKAKEEGLRAQLVGIEFEAASYEDIAQRERIYHRGIDVGFIRTVIYGYSVDKNIGFAVLESDTVPLDAQVHVGASKTPAMLVDRRWL